MKICTLALALGGLFLSAGARAAPVTISPAAGGYRVAAPGYQATVASDGCLTSLRVGGKEFFASSRGATGGIPRGAYFYQDGLLSLPAPGRPAADAVTAKSDRASVRYVFGASSVTLSLTNLTDKAMLFIIVFDPGVGAVRVGPKDYERAPLAWPVTDATFFRGKWRLRITDGTRIWGPWSGNHQVWQTDLAARQTRKVTLEPAAATAAELAAVREAIERVSKPPTNPVGPMWDLERFSKPPAVTEAEGFSYDPVTATDHESEGLGVKALATTGPGAKALSGGTIRAIYYAGPPFRGHPTRVFAWLGVPKVEPGRKVPGMVLVHGGGGTAFAAWVALWMSRGYAAIAMDTCGCVPRGSYGAWERDPEGGPPGWGGFDQIDWPREDQWTFHAVADVILADSLLRSLPEVDANRIGLTGISWGGYLTCIVAGVDPRFRLAVPVYGCGFYIDTLFGDNLRAMSAEERDRWVRWWDPSVYLPKAAMPMLWVDGSNDFAYTMNALQKSYRLPTGPRTLCIRLRMPHGHGGAGELPEEIRVFAASLLRGGKPLAEVTGQGRDGREVWVTYRSAVPVVKAELNVTKDLGKWQDRNWVALPAKMAAPGKVTATLPAGVTVYYLNLFDERGCAVSTDHVELGGKTGVAKGG